MYKILDGINNPNDLKKLNNEDIKMLCFEIRDFLVKTVSKTGGHLASNLGVVELTVAMNLVFDFPKDKIVWDVGHQSYVHKILTGRKDKFATLRQYEGLSGFPKTNESEYDCFNTGHSSTSISAALGMATARDLKNDNYNVVAFFGDGAMTGGMMYEALNNLGHLSSPMVLVLNDNQMSISQNVGALSQYLRHLRQTPGYRNSKRKMEVALDKMPHIGGTVKKTLSKVKTVVKTNVIPSTLFDDLDIEYLGPVDGHNIEELKNVFKLAIEMKKPVIVHAITKKGKGYLPAEEKPQLYHGISPKSNAKCLAEYKDYSDCAGKTLVSLAEKNKKIVAITAAMTQGVGLEEFSTKFPKRFFDVGIAEEHAVTFAAGMAINGLVPVFSVYSTFLQRSYDQIMHDVCLQKLHVVFLIDRAGVVGADGETHHGMNDIAFMSDMPYMTVLSPSSFDDLKNMIDFAVNKCDGPVAIRYPRGNVSANEGMEFHFGECRTYGNGAENVIVTTGRMLKTAVEASAILKEKNISVDIVEMPTVLPVPMGFCNAISGRKLIVALEDHCENGGIGDIVAKEIAKNNMSAKFIPLAYPKEPIVHGRVAELDKKYGLDKDSVAEAIIKEL